MKLKKLLSFVGLQRFKKDKREKIMSEIDSIIKLNKLSMDNRYDKLFEMLELNKLTTNTQLEIKEKFDEVLTKERFEMLDESNKKFNLRDYYYGKKDGKESEVKKISINEYKWSGETSRGLNESGINDTFWNSGKKVWIDKDRMVLHSNTHLVNQGDRLTPTQMEYLNQYGVRFIEGSK